METSAEPNRTFSARKAVVHFIGALGWIFQVTDGVIHYPPDAYRFLKAALLREHGYLYIASVEEPQRKRTWRCAVKDCPNTVVDEF